MNWQKPDYYATLAGFFNQTEDEVRWAIWLGTWRLIGLWENNPPHIRAMVMK